MIGEREPAGRKALVMVELVRAVAHRCCRSFPISIRGSWEGITYGPLDVQCVVPHRGLDKATTHGRRDIG